MALTIWELNNDTRGWIMCIISGIACVFGASIICVDWIVRLFPGKKNFRIEESSVFLASSLSLSFGVMMFSSLYSMLPESKSYLKKEKWSDQAAGFLIMGCFIGGFIGIQAVSRVLHQYMPSHVVDCDHTHDETAKPDDDTHSNGRKHSRVSRARRRTSRNHASHNHAHKHIATAPNGSSLVGETTPLLQSDNHTDSSLPHRHASDRAGEMAERSLSPLLAGRRRARTDDTADANRRTSMLLVQKRVMSFVKDTKSNCDEQDACFGFTDPCVQECFKHTNSRSESDFQEGQMLPNEDPNERLVGPRFHPSQATSRDHVHHAHDEDDDEDEDETAAGESRTRSCSPMDQGEEDIEAQHHHHVPTNAFLSIGLQTSIAIALHKFPEGFITYATNHANPELGFSVFMALFVHNITEGFAMALPLYMALGSRWRAMAWSALLGGLSQPFGAAIAVLWFKVANKTNMTPDAVAYACLFAITSGIMVSVALQLFVESLTLTHNRNLCIFFGFLGMALLGLSNASFAGH